jgi:hypothetical protein
MRSPLQREAGHPPLALQNVLASFDELACPCDGAVVDRVRGHSGILTETAPNPPCGSVWMTGGRARAIGARKSVQGGTTVARTTQKTQRRREAAPLREGRFGRGSSGKAQASGRFGRASGRPSGRAARRRRGQPEQSGAQKLMQAIRGVLPGGSGKSSAKSGRRGRKPAMFGVLGAGAAGAAAAVARRRHGRSSQATGETGDMSEAQATSPAPATPAQPGGAPPPGGTAHEPVAPPDPDGPPAGETG